jgi:hypothetical protein
VIAKYAERTRQIVTDYYTHQQDLPSREIFAARLFAANECEGISWVRKLPLWGHGRFISLARGTHFLGSGLFASGISFYATGNNHTYFYNSFKNKVLSISAKELQLFN